VKRVLLVDDHLMFLEALRGLLDQHPGLEVVGVARSGLDVLAQARALLPDIVCMDIGMPGMNGIDATRQLLESLPSVKVIALSTHADHIYVSDMMKAGAAAYVSKSEGGRELMRAIEAVSSHRTYWCPSAAEVLARAMTASGELSGIVRDLAPREQQVLRLVAQGLNSQAIAEQLGIAVGTVDVHRRNIMRKLGLHNAVELTRYAIRHGLAAD
jgi:DNA-binding NarL/FixJ family response regulator